MKKLSLLAISTYRKFLSFDTGFGRLILPFALTGSGQVCKYSPACSEYTSQAISKYGIIKGLMLGVWRILRCNPWGKGGWDPVK